MQNETKQADGSEPIGVGSKIFLEGNLDITEQLGSGATAVVYKGHYRNQIVAVKVMHQQVSEVTRSFFLSEGTNLRALRQNWAQVWPNDALAVPDLILDQRRGSQPFLVMEFVQGKTIEDLLKEGCKFTEFEALELGIQFGKVLVVLHETMNSCYADIKFDNLWLLDKVESKSRPQLKVTDWNVLSEKTEDRVQRDLFYASQFLYRFLTKVSLPLRGLQIEGRVENQESYKRLSMAMQRFFQMALHPNPAFRFSNAREWVAYLSEIASWWPQEAYEVYPTIARLLEQAIGLRENRKLVESAQIMRRMRDMLDNLSREERGDRMGDANVVNMFDGKIKEELESTSELKSGQILLDSRSFAEAAQTFLRGAELNALAPEKLLRYYWLARAAQTLGREWFDIYNATESQSADKNQLVMGIESFFAGDTRVAQEVFTKAADQLGQRAPEELKALRDELVILQLADQASQSRKLGKYGEAEKALDHAYQLYRKQPPYPKTTWAETLGDVYQLWQSARRELDTIGESLRQREEAKKALAAGQWDQAAQHFMAAVEAVEQSDEAVGEWQQAVQDHLMAGDVNAAMTLGERSLGIENARQKVLPLWQIGRQIRRIDDLHKQGQWNEAFEQLQQYVRQYADSPVGINKALHTVAMDLFEDSRARNQREQSAKVPELLRRWNADWAREMDQKLQDDQRSRILHIEEDISNTLKRINDLHQRRTLEDSNQAIKLIKEFRAFVNPQDPRRTDQEKLFEEVIVQQKTLEAKQREGVQHNEELIKKHAQEFRQLKQQVEQLEKLAMGLEKDEFEDLDLKEHIERVKARKIARMIEQSFFLQKLDPTHIDSEVKNVFDTAADQAEAQKNVRIWMELRGRIDAMLAPLLASLDKCGESFYQTGDPSECKAFSREYPNLMENRAQLKADLAHADSFALWITALSKVVTNDVLTQPERALLDQYGFNQMGLQTWREKNLPPAIIKYHQARLLDLMEKRAAQLSSRLAAMTTKDGDTFYALMADWLDIHQAMDLIRYPTGESAQPAVTVEAVVADLRQGFGKKPTGAEKNAIKQAHERLKQNRLTGLVTPQAVRGAFAQQGKITLPGGHEISRTAAIAGLAGVVVLVLLVIALAVWGSGWFGGDEGTPDPTPTVPIVVEATVIDATARGDNPVPPTEVTAVPTEEPTVEPTVTPTNETPAPPAPVSAFAFPIENAPILPAGLMGLYLIDDSSAQFTPEQGYWYAASNTQDGNNAYGEGLHTANTTLQEDATARWVMDMGLPEDGYYEIFVSDTNSASGQVEKALTYEVTQNDVVVSPVRGSSSIRQYTRDNHAYLKQTDLTWRSLGVYMLNRDGLITVTLNLKGVVLHNSRIAGVDAMVIARVERPAAENPFVLYQPDVKSWMENNRLFLWMDQPVGPDGVELKHEDMEGGTWGGVDSIDLATVPAGTEAALTWNFTHPLLAPGKYEIFAFVANNLSADGNYEVTLANGPKVDQVTPAHKDPDLPGSPGTLVSLGVIEVPAYDGAANGDLPVMLTVKLKAAEGQTAGILAGDVIFIVAID